MDIRQLRYFCTICEEGQITAAAKKLHMAQPPLSQALQALEMELGVSLLKRGARTIQLTEAGELLRERAEQILDLCDGVKNELLDQGIFTHKTLHVGIVSSSHNAFLVNGLRQFHEDYPNVSYQLREGNTFQILDMLQKGIIELGIVRTPFVQHQMKTYSLGKEAMVAVYAKEHFSIETAILTLPELHQYPLIYYERYASLIQELFMEYGLSANIICQNQDARTTLLWAKEGIGIAIVPKSACSQVDCRDLVLCEIHEKRLQTEIMLIYRKDRYLSDTAQTLLSYFQEKKGR